MMKRLVYVLAVKPERSVCPSLGVYKKVLAQVEAMNRSEIHADLLEVEMQPRWKRLLPFSTSSIDWRNISFSKEVDYIYIRYCCSDFQFLKALRRWKQQQPTLKIIIELPSYPYRQELKLTPIKLRDYIYANLLHYCADTFVTYSNCNIKKIYKTPTIYIGNGIDLSKVKKRKPSGDSSIVMCAVANFSFWHGIDRLLNGMIKYYRMGGKKEVRLILVGAESEELTKLKSIASNSLLDGKVIFTGALDGDELDGVYNRANIGVECLGLFRKGNNLVSSSLKSREYLAKGLPFIYSDKIDVIEENYKYALHLPESEEPISIDSIVKFYNLIYSSGEQKVINEIREFAENNISITNTMRPILEFIKNDD